MHRFLRSCPSSTPLGRAVFLTRFIIALGIATAWAGCQSANAPTLPTADVSTAPEILKISEGDVLKITFPGAPKLDVEQQVRRDGRISLGVVGEIVVVGMTPATLEEHLRKLYDADLVIKEVSVTVISSRFTVFVTGAVIHPGKITVDHPLTALEALMEAGGFDTGRADSKGVVVIRQVDGKTKNYSINLKDVLEGRANEPFLLKQQDIIYVPERFNWF